jgi:hypothetical protein
LDGQVREYQRDKLGKIESRIRSYGDWGYDYYLYPQWLEDNLQFIETRASSTYRKLVDWGPVTSEDRYYWIAFVVAQLVRTPKAIADLGARMRALVKQQRWAYGTHPENLRAAHETLFLNDKFFGVMFRRIDSRQWTRLRAAKDASLLRSDAPVISVGSYEREDWALFYPLTPELCLRMGPNSQGETGLTVDGTLQLTARETGALNRAIALTARRSVIALTGDSEEAWRSTLAGDLCSATPDYLKEYRSWGRLWNK